jgi:hypothetical protein
MLVESSPNGSPGFSIEKKLLRTYIANTIFCVVDAKSKRIDDIGWWLAFCQFHCLLLVNAPEKVSWAFLYRFLLYLDVHIVNYKTHDA